jgi:hypothetical protein
MPNRYLAAPLEMHFRCEMETSDLPVADRRPNPRRSASILASLRDPPPSGLLSSPLLDFLHRCRLQLWRGPGLAACRRPAVSQPWLPAPSPSPPGTSSGLLQVDSLIFLDDHIGIMWLMEDHIGIMTNK